MPIPQIDIERALQKKGFEREERDHKTFFFRSSSGRRTSLRTKTSHGTSHKTLSDGLVAHMARQCGLTIKQFKLFVACNISHEDYEIIVRQNKSLIE